MHRTLEAIGSRLLGRLVPRIDAAAACGPAQLICYASCWQCNYGACLAECHSGCGCQAIACNVHC